MFKAKYQSIRKRYRTSNNNQLQFETLEPRQLLAATINSPLAVDDVGFRIEDTGDVTRGRLFHDEDLNGRRNAGETWLTNWVVFEDTNSNQQLDAQENFTVTDRRGRFHLDTSNNGDVTPHLALDLGIAADVQPESLVNTTTHRVQIYPSVASSAAGNSIAAWTSFRQDGEGWGVYGQRFDAQGFKIGPEFQINTETNSAQFRPSVAAFDDGSFMVAWMSLRQDPNTDFSGWGVYGQMFAADGTRIGSETRINQTTFSHQSHPVVETLSNGNFVVGWQGLGRVHSDVYRHGIYHRLYDSNFSPLTDEVQVSNENFGGDRQFDITATPGGEYVFAFQASAVPDRNGIYVRRFSNDGSYDGSIWLVNQFHRDGGQYQPSITSNDRGDLLVSWTSNFGDHSGKVVYAQPMNADFSFDTLPVAVAQEFRGRQWRSNVAWLTEDTYAVVWQGRGDGENNGVFIREFDNMNRPLGPELRLSDAKNGFQSHVEVVASAAGLTTVWHGKGEADRFGIYSRLLSLDQEMGASISGVVFDDLNGNGVRDGLVSGDEPDIVFVVDVSGSTTAQFAGDPVGDLNNDGQLDTILDAEIAGFEALVDELINIGLGDIADVSIVSYDSFADRVTPTPLKPNQDDDNNGVPDIKDNLRNLRSGSSTNFEAGLQESINVLMDQQTEFENGNLIFLSDGFPNSGGSFDDEVATLNSLAVNVRAFGVGNGASLNSLQTIDPNAEIFTSTNELLQVFGGLGGGSGSGGGNSGGGVMEPGLSGVTVFLDRNNNGIFDSNERSVVSDAATGAYSFDNLAPGDYVVRVILPPDSTLTAPSSGFHDVTLDPTDNLRMLNFGITLNDGEDEAT